MLNNYELGKAYGFGYYKRNEHDIIADAYVFGRETFRYRRDSSMTRKQALGFHVLECRRKVRKDLWKEEKRKVSIDDIEELAAPDGEFYFEEVGQIFLGQYERPFNPEQVLNKILVQEVKTLVDSLVSGHNKKTRQMLLLYYGKQMTLEKIGKRFKCSKSTVERRIKKAISELRAIVQRKGLEYQDYTRCESKFASRLPKMECTWRLANAEEVREAA